MILDPRHPPHRLLRHRNLCAFSSEARALLSGPLEHPTSEPRKTGDAHYPESKVSRKGRTTTSSLSEPPPSWSEGTKRAELSCLTLRVSFMFPIVHSCRPCPELPLGVTGLPVSLPSSCSKASFSLDLLPKHSI